MNFAQSTIFNIVASFGLLFVNMLINVVETRILGPTEIGRYQVFVTTQTMFATVCSLGIGQSCIYFINRLNYNERHILSTAINATLPIATLSSIALFLMLLLNPSYFGEESITYLALFAIGTDALLINNIFGPVLLTKMEVVRTQIVKYSTRILTLIAFLLVWILGQELSVGFLLGLSGVTSVIALGLLYYYLYPRFSFKDGIDFSLLWRIYKWGLKLAGNNIASLTLLSVPVYFLTWFSVGNGFLDVGYYSRANTLLVIGTTIASSVGPLLYSKWSGTAADELKNQVRRMSFLYIVVNLIIALALVVCAHIVIYVLYGDDFMSAVPILQLLALSLIGTGCKEVCYGILSSQGAPLLIMKNLIIGAILCAIADYFVIPIYGVCGCALVTTAVSFATAFLLMNDVTRVSRIEMADFFVVPTRSEFLNIVRQINFFRK